MKFMKFDDSVFPRKQYVTLIFCSVLFALFLFVRCASTNNTPQKGMTKEDPIRFLPLVEMTEYELMQ